MSQPSLPLPKESHLRVRSRSPASVASIVTWGVLIFCFLALYTPSFRSIAAELPVLPLLMVLIAAQWVFRYRRNRRWTRLHERGTARLRLGDNEGAVRDLDEAARRSGGAPRALAVYNLGVCALQQRGDIARALELFSAAEQSGQLLTTYPAAHAATASLIATCLALQGDLTAARRWLEEALRRSGGTAMSMSLLAEVIVLCREGHFGAAAKIIDSRWREAEQAGAWVMKALRLLKAFALRELDPVAHERGIYVALAGMKPWWRGELDGLAASWPKLADFMTERGLSTAAVA